MDPTLVGSEQTLINIQSALGWLGFVFGMICQTGYGYKAGGSGPRAVHVAKMSSRVISKKGYCSSGFIVQYEIY